MQYRYNDYTDSASAACFDIKNDTVIDYDCDKSSSGDDDDCHFDNDGASCDDYVDDSNDDTLLD